MAEYFTAIIRNAPYPAEAHIGLMLERDQLISAEDNDRPAPAYKVGFRRPPLHSRIQPGRSGNPAGRPKGLPNLKTILEQVLREQISLREGNVTKKITKAEAIIRGL